MKRKRNKKIVYGCCLIGKTNKTKEKKNMLMINFFRFRIYHNLLQPIHIFHILLVNGKITN